MSFSVFIFTKNKVVNPAIHLSKSLSHFIRHSSKESFNLLAMLYRRCFISIRKESFIYLLISSLHYTSKYICWFHCKLLYSFSNNTKLLTNARSLYKFLSKVFSLSSLLAIISSRNFLFISSIIDNITKPSCILSHHIIIIGSLNLFASLLYMSHDSAHLSLGHLFTISYKWHRFFTVRGSFFNFSSRRVIPIDSVTRFSRTIQSLRRKLLMIFANTSSFTFSFT